MEIHWKIRFYRMKIRNKIRENKFRMQILAMRFLLGKKRFDFWAWNLTPMPMGEPYPYQYWDGLLLRFPFLKIIKGFSKEALEQ